MCRISKYLWTKKYIYGLKIYMCTKNIFVDKKIHLWTKIYICGPKIYLWTKNMYIVNKIYLLSKKICVV